MENCSTVPVPECPGRYCGRTVMDPEGEISAQTCYSDCSACPEGYRVGTNGSLCVSCDDPAFMRDYLFLGFVCLVCVLVRLAIIVAANAGESGWPSKLGLIGMSLLEKSLAMLFTLLVLEPQGSLGFNSCRVRDVADFYPIFFNPTTDYVHHLQCSSEVVFPLYRMIFIFLGFYLLTHILFYPVLVPYMLFFKSSLKPSTEFAWLVVLPVIAIIFAVLGGLFYYSFDYITIVFSVGGYAAVSTVMMTQATTYNFKNPFRLAKRLNYWTFTLLCMLVLAYGILSLTDAGSIEFRSKLLPTVVALPLLHPLLSFFSSPQPYLLAWGLDSYRDLHQH